MPSDEDIDSEWEDYERIVNEYNTKRRKILASPVLQRRKHIDDLRPLPTNEERVQAHNATTFYPAPATVTDTDDLYNYATKGSHMYGRYTKELKEYAKDEASKLRFTKSKVKEEIFQHRGDELYKYRGKCTSKLMAAIGFTWRHTFARLGEDWVFLALLGFVMAVLSFFVDYGITFTNEGRLWLYKDLASNPVVQYIAWVFLPVCLVIFSAGFVHIVAPQSIGSGIPEMKTILRGVALKEYLTFRTLVAKVIGLTATLGSGLPLGKEGPFVHIASITATLLSKLITSFEGIYKNESRNSEMLAAACAVGVASTFGAPIGGVLFSIEVTTVYFAVRNYWRGFFTAVCGATVFRLLAVFFNKADTVKAFFPTHYTMEYPFDPQELAVFAFIGRFLYPGVITFITTTVTFPLAIGKYMAGDLTTDEQLSGLFSNFTWTKEEFSIKEREILEHWRTPNTSVFISLIGYMSYYFIFSIICSTIPVPSGSFIPVFKIGAAFGRIIGELIHMHFPNGVRHGKYITPVIPGGYATVGAAAFSGAVTHSFSVSVIAFEMTGQITHIIPMMIAVLISNAVAALLQPSLYDSIILIKKLPYLPDLLPSNSGVYNVYVEDFMVRSVKYIWQNISYKDLKSILKEYRRIRAFPIVDHPDSMILLGSVQRLELIRLIEEHIGRERRLQVVAKWQKEAQERLSELERRRRLDSQRRPSRFEVIPAPDLLKMKQLSSSDLRSRCNNECTISSLLDRQPKKSILKKTNSFHLRSFPTLMNSSVSTPYSTITGAESRIRLAFEAIFHKSTTLRDANPDVELGNENPSSSPATFKKVQLPRERVIDMSPEDQREWEEEEMEQNVNFEHCHIDPAPFQLVEKTSLLKVHSIFSLIGVNHAYVTAVGRLIGVVGLTELRKAIEDCNAGIVPTTLTTPNSPILISENGGVTEALLSKETELTNDNKDQEIVNGALTNSNVV